MVTETDLFRPTPRKGRIRSKLKVLDYASNYTSAVQVQVQVSCHAVSSVTVRHLGAHLFHLLGGFVHHLLEYDGSYFPAQRHQQS